MGRQQARTSRRTDETRAAHQQREKKGTRAVDNASLATRREAARGGLAGLATKTAPKPTPTPKPAPTATKSKTAQRSAASGSGTRRQ